MTDSGDVYIDNAVGSKRIEKLAMNTSAYVPALFICSACIDIAVDVMNNLYCTLFNQHQVVSISLTSRLNLWSIVAGTGVAAATTDGLNGPVGVFVDRNLDLYVCDRDNNRVQKYRYGQRNGTTVVGAAAAGTISLNGPHSVTMDADGYLFITDNRNHRIIGQDSTGFRCIAACDGGSGANALRLTFPTAARFDRFGNIFVTDAGNHRIQRFTLLSNGCSESFSLINESSFRPIPT